MNSRWIVTPHPNRLAAVRLICVPHAGGGIGTFDGWAERLPAADLGIVQLPGRWTRIGEPAVASVPDAADGVAGALAAIPALPTLLFGHGVGALIAFETARRLRDRSWPLLALFVSGRRAPGVPDPLPPISGLPADAFLLEVRARLDGLTDTLVADPDLRPVFVQGLRADFAMAERYEYAPAPPLSCPIIACAGSRDPHATATDLQGWSAETRSRFRAHTLSGTQAFVISERASVTRLIANETSVLLSVLARGAGLP
jgi:medium-chain acyl-[acyl-carrier-protein] hydrolase